jgi:hypothetical protein
MDTKRIQNAEAFGAGVDTSSNRTRTLLACGAAAGPVYIAVAFIQGLTREGFDFSRHAVSLLSNGELGWIQIINFIVAGLLVLAGAAGMQRALRGSRGGASGPFFLGVYGLGLIGAGIFIADPASGFPPGTPAGSNAVSWHGLMHFISGGIGFLGLIAACFSFARRFAGLRQRGWAAYSAVTGLIFFAAFLGIASGSGQSAVILAFWFASVLAWAWISVMSIRLFGEIAE